ncbi:MAG: error-prone DNA polymerase [Phycisphaerae bacterium]|jgi:error-prone DNA polymerase
MPDTPPPNLRIRPDPALPLDPAGDASHSAPYAELHCLSNFSFLRGASHPEELVARAAELGYAALAITDRDSLAGVVRAHLAAREHNLPLIIGAEITPLDAPAAVLLAPTRQAYANLARLITLGRRRAAKGDCILYLQDVSDLAAGLQAIVRPGDTPSIPALSTYRDIFADRAFLAAELTCDLPDDARLAQLATLARDVHLPLVAANDVHYHVPQRRYLQDVLTCIREQCPLTEAGARLFANAERHLRPRDEITRRYAAHPAALARTVAIAQSCTFSLDELRYEYPPELCPPGRTPLAHLTELIWQGARRRYADGLPDKIRRQLERELALIAELQYEHYFLTVWDLVRFARERGIVCQGRGSAANSAVCYCLGVTAVDPARCDLLFERFISRERDEPPDIDVDFEHERREEVFQYIYGKYGRERAALTAEVITYRPRSAVRDVGKVLGLSLDRVDALAKALDWWSDEPVPAEALATAGLDPASRTVRMLIRLVQQLLGFPRHLSQHVGGFVITATPLCEIVPLENAAMPDRTFIEWDKNDIDALGILKIDCLALGMLTAISKCFGLLAARDGAAPTTLAAIPAEDPAVYDMICAADTIGVFQIESRAQMSMLPRLRPRNFYDLVIEVAIVRPGPIQGGMVHPFLRRRHGEETVTYPSPAVREVLQKTLGVPLFQEQVMRIAVVAAGFSPGEADQLRRSMGAWRRSGALHHFQIKLIEGMLTNGYGREFAEQIYKQIRGFGEYGFPESHAASFALLVYASAWLKHYHPAAFCAALLNAQPLGFYTPGQLVRDARVHGVTVRGADVNYSNWDCTLEDSGDAPTLRLGFRVIRGLSAEKVRGVVAARDAGPLRSVERLAHRPDVTRDTLLRLAAADAFRSLGLDRRQALWQLLATDDTDPPLLAGLEPDEPPAALPAMTLDETVVRDYDSVGFSLNAHPFDLIRAELNTMKVTPNGRLRHLPNGRPVTVAGLVTVRQRPGTARGIVFMTLEDETGTANLVVHPPIWERDKRSARGRLAVLARGHIERQGEVIHVVVRQLEDLSPRLATLAHRSRDFH